jgi:hypothetical protein
MSEDTKPMLKLTVEFLDDDNDEHDITATCLEIPGILGRGPTLMDAFTDFLFELKYGRR